MRLLLTAAHVRYDTDLVIRRSRSFDRPNPSGRRVARTRGSTASNSYPLRSTRCTTPLLVAVADRKRKGIRAVRRSA